MFEVEPNSTIETATPLALGAAISGHIFLVDDVDTYRIDIAGVEGDSTPVGKLSIDLDAGYGARLTLKLWDSAGYEISQVASKQIARPLHMAFDAPAGAYYLSVTGSGDNCGKPYTIRTGFDAKPGVAVPAPSAPNGDLGVQPAAQRRPNHASRRNLAPPFPRLALPVAFSSSSPEICATILARSRWDVKRFSGEK